jgi:predicted lipid-binding transport protein (Tim44 family)
MSGMIGALAAKFGVGLVVFLLAAGGLTAFIEVEKHRAVAAVVAEYEAKTAREHERRRDELVASQKQGELVAAALLKVETHNADQLQVIARLSSRSDARACLDPDLVQRIAEIGRKAGDGTEPPRGAAAGGPGRALRQPR